MKYDGEESTQQKNRTRVTVNYKQDTGNSKIEPGHR